MIGLQIIKLFRVISAKIYLCQNVHVQNYKRLSNREATDLKTIKFQICGIKLRQTQSLLTINTF